MVWWVPCGRTPVRSPRARLAGAVKAMPTDGSPAWPLQPFAPFSKNDRVGRACEWNFTRERERFRREWQRYDRQGEPSPFVMEQVDEEGFHLVEQKTPAKPKWGPGARGGRGGMRGGMRYAACAAKRVRQRGRCDGASHSRGGLCSRVVLTELSVFLPPVRVWGRVQTFVRAFVCRCLCPRATCISRPRPPCLLALLRPCGATSEGSVSVIAVLEYGRRGAEARWPVGPQERGCAEDAEAYVCARPCASHAVLPAMSPPARPGST